MTKIKETASTFFALEERFGYFFRQLNADPLSISLKTRFPLSYASPFSRVHGPIILTRVSQSGSFINASPILATKRSAKHTERVYNPFELSHLQSLRLLLLSLAFRYPGGFLLKCCSLFTQHTYARTHTHTYISQTRFVDSFAFFANVLLPRLLLFPFRSTPQSKNTLFPSLLPSQQSLTFRFPLV